MSGPPDPRVSVVMATLNAERFLGDALASVRGQTYEDLEIVIVDGGSTDRTVAIAIEHGARVVPQEGEGLFGAWNEGIAAARGELIALLDSDDRWEPGKLEAQVRALDARPELDYVIGRVRFFLEPGLPYPPGFRPELMGADHVAPMPGVLLARRSVFDVVGPFRTEYAIASDVDWFVRLRDAGLRREVVEGALIHKRLHDSNLSHFQAETMNDEILTLQRRSIARKRGDG